MFVPCPFRLLCKGFTAPGFHRFSAAKPLLRRASTKQQQQQQQHRQSKPCSVRSPLIRPARSQRPSLSSASSSSSPPPSPSSSSSSSSSSSTRYLAWTANVVLGLCAIVWLRDHHVEVHRVTGSSMAPTLNPGFNETGKRDWVIVMPFTERHWREDRSEGEEEQEQEQEEEEEKKTKKKKKTNQQGLNKGDVVVFWKPHDPKGMGIKRVVAVQGDVVTPRRGYAWDDGVREGRAQGMPDGLADRDPDAMSHDEAGKIVVPYGHVWVEGDNWRTSRDSNDYGPISKGLLLGKVVWVWREWTHVRKIGDERTNMERRRNSRVLSGRAEIPDVFLE